MLPPPQPPKPSGEAEAGGSLETRLHIAEDGFVTILTGKIEEGQGARTELAMAAAEELRVPLDRVRMLMGDTDQSPNDGTTAGSGTTPQDGAAGAQSRRGGPPIAPGRGQPAVPGRSRAA